jgi:3-deoxy-D-manno-octulosonic-acid transferase
MYFFQTFQFANMRLQLSENSALLLLDAFYVFLLILLSPWWLLMLAIKPAFRAGFRARFALRHANIPLQESIWLHGSSAGEVDLLRPLVRKLEQGPESCSVVVSAFSISGYTAAKKLFPQHCVIFFPADFSPVIKRFLKALNPRLIVLVESEFWPNFISTASKSGIPTCVLNGRMSQKSFQAHKRTQLIPWALRKVSFLAVQSEEDAARFRDLGVASSRITITGNMKYDLQDRTGSQDWQQVRRTLREHHGIDEDMPVLIGGSIHLGEDQALAWAYQRLISDGYRLRMILVPRYPAETSAVTRALQSQDLIAARRSELSADNAKLFADSRRVLIVDTIGELKNYYAMSDIAFVGGSLDFRGSNKGGHNLMEPAILGLTVMFGPHNYSFRETVRDLLNNSAGLLVHDRDELYSCLKGLLDKPASATDMGKRAREVILNKQGATGLNFALLEQYLPLS